MITTTQTGRQQRVLNAAASRLKWKVVMRRLLGRGSYETTSDPATRTHTILLPKDMSSDEAFHVVHELTHAYMAERYSHLFATAYFEPGTPDSAIRSVADAVRAAQDWFVDWEQSKLDPGWFTDEIAYDASILYSILSGGRGVPPIYSGLVAAQVAYHGLRVRVGPIGAIGEALKSALLSIDPRSATIESLVHLADKLATIVHASIGLSLAEHDGLAVFRIEKRA